MKFENTHAPLTTPTRDVLQMCEKVGNVYETVVLLGKRANQISSALKKEIDASIKDFADQQDVAEEMFENKEQTDISKSFEMLPKATLIATQEFIEDKLEYNTGSKDDQLK